MMEQIPVNNSGPDNRSAATAATSLGGMLREAREKQGLSVADVAGQIKFAPRQIEALEADDFKHLPETAFLRGFVRSYAKILRLDAEVLLASMPQTKAVSAELTPASVDVPFPNAHSLRQQNLIWLGAASLLGVIVLGFAFWHFNTPPVKQPKVSQVETPVTLPAEAKVVSEPLVLKSSTIEPLAPVVPKARPEAAQSSVKDEKSQAPVRESKMPASVHETKTPIVKAAPQVQSISSTALPDAPPQTAELRLVFGEESWTEIKDKDGNLLSSQVNPPGSELHLEGYAPFSLLIGHAASVSLYYRGKQVDLKPHTNQHSEVAHLKLK